MSDDGFRLDDMLCFPLYAASRLVTQAYRTHLDALGLTYAQFLVLLVLGERDEQTVRELGERLYLDSGTLTPLLQRMERAGLVRRERRRDDERTVETRLTPAGRRMRKKASQVPLAVLCDVGLPVEDAVRLREEVKSLVRRLDAAQRPPAARETPTR